MLNRIFLAACLFAALAACEKPEEPAAGAPVKELAPPMNDKPTISAAPEHFDRMRAEQFEKEEDRLRRSRR